MLKYSEYISQKLAKKLLANGFHLFNYKGGTYDGKPYFDVPSQGEPGWADGDRYRIPTYGEVFEWFSQERGIVITLEPFFTMALGGHTAYTWKISYPDEKMPALKNISEMDMWKSGSFGGSFCPTADAAIEFAMTLGDRRLKFVEVDINTL